MGCWNGTDLLGGMPLRAGEKIYAVITVNTNRPVKPAGFTYINNGYCQPISFPIEGVYNDYGGIEFDENQLPVVLLKMYLTRNLSLIEVEESRGSWDKTFTEDSLKNMNEFVNDFIERNRVSLDVSKSIYGATGHGMVGFVMYSKTIIDSITLATFDTDEEFESVSDSSLKQDIRFFEEDVLLNQGDDDRSFRSDTWEAECRHVGRWTNMCRRLDNLDSVHSSSFRYYLRELKEIYKVADNIDTLSKHFNKMVFDMITLISAMDSLRLSWSANSGKGSQYYGAKEKLGLVRGILTQINQYFSDYYDDGEETPPDVKPRFELIDNKPDEEIGGY